MKNQAVDQYLTAIYKKYQEGSKKEKSRLLDHSELITKRSRKQLIRRLNKISKDPSSVKKSGRPLVYSKEELIPHIKHLWMSAERISPKRLKASFKDWLPKYKTCPAHLKMQLLKISPTTLDRYLKEIRQNEKVQKGLSTTCPARYMKNKVEKSRHDWASQFSRLMGHL